MLELLAAASLVGSQAISEQDPNVGHYLCEPEICSIELNPSREALLERAGDCVDAAARLEAVPPGHPSVDPYVSHSWAYDTYFLCMAPFAEIGVDAREIASTIRPLIDSPEPLVRAHAIEILGHIGDETSRPRLVALLDSPVWQDVLTAAQALGNLGGIDRQILVEVAASHWWREVRTEAHTASFQLAGEAGSLNARAEIRDEHDWLRTFRIQRFGPYDRRDVRNVVCPSEKFDFRGMPAEFAANRSDPTEPIQIGGQYLSVRGTGYEGDYVLNLAQPGEERTILRLRAIGIFQTSETDALIVTGNEHLGEQGYLFRLMVTENGPRTIRLADLHFSPYWAAEIAPNFFGVRTEAGFFVFDETGMLGEAACVAGPLPNPPPR